MNSGRIETRSPRPARLLRPPSNAFGRAFHRTMNLFGRATSKRKTSRERVDPAFEQGDCPSACRSTPEASPADVEIRTEIGRCDLKTYRHRPIQGLAPRQHRKDCQRLSARASILLSPRPSWLSCAPIVVGSSTTSSGPRQPRRRVDHRACPACGPGGPLGLRPPSMIAPPPGRSSRPCVDR